MKNNILILLLALIALLGTTLTAQENKPEMDATAEGFYRLGFGVPPQPIDAPDFRVPNLAGDEVSLSSLEGKVVLLNFWATWCPPCRAEMPAMENVYNELKDEGFDIIAISTRDARETRSKVVDYIAENGYTFPVLFDQTGAAVPPFYRTGSIPTSYVIDKEGKVVARLIGAYEWDNDEIIELLRELTRS